MNKKTIILILWVLWFIISWTWIYYLLENNYLSSDLTNTYIIFPNGWHYNAPTWYMEYYLWKEWWWMNKYTINHMIDFPSWIDLSH